MLDDSKMFFTLFTGLGCGVCLGWILRSRICKLPKFIRGTSAVEETSDGLTSGTKLVLIVRNDLKMGKGKAAAQCAHAAVLAYKQLQKSNVESLKQWEWFGQQKVVLKVEDEESLLEIIRQAKLEGLTTSLVCDAGRTQVAPGSRTVAGIGPGEKSLIDKVTGHLKLY